MEVDRGIAAGTTEDPLSLVLETVRLRSSFYGLADMTAPWGFAVTAPASVDFHIQLAGESQLDVDGRREAVRLEAGDVAVLPHGLPHRLRSSEGVDCRPIEDLIPSDPSNGHVIQGGGGGALARMLCGGFQVDEGSSHPLLRAMPAVILVRASQREAWLDSTLQIIAAEASSGRGGGSAVVRRLSDVLLIQCLRHHIEHDPDVVQAGPRSWIGGLRDPRIAKALLEIHRSPEASWTVERLAAVAGMSRSAFAERFMELVSVSPAAYLAQWRLQHAIRLLRETRLGLAEIALRVGYESESAFSRAFRRSKGLAPGQLRRTLHVPAGGGSGRRATFAG